MTKYYAVARHGSAGLDSYGYAEVWVGADPPRRDQTTTVSGPYTTHRDAERAAIQMQRQMNEYARAQDAR